MLPWRLIKCKLFEDLALVVGLGQNVCGVDAACRSKHKQHNQKLHCGVSDAIELFEVLQKVQGRLLLQHTAVKSGLTLGMHCMARNNS